MLAFQNDPGFSPTSSVGSEQKGLLQTYYVPVLNEGLG